MEFFNDIGADPLKPSIFELVAQEQLKDLLQPALKYVLAVFAQRYPRYLLRLVNRHEEFYALIMLVVERHYLTKHNASFSENFYGLKRRRRPFIETERTKAAVGQALSGEKLRSTEIWKSLAFLVGIPYVRAKMQDYFEELGGGVSSDVVEEAMDSRQIQLLTDQSLRGRFRRAFKRMYPWMNMGFEFWLLVYNISYLFNQTPAYRPWLNWIGVDLRRLGPEDFKVASLTNRTPGNPQLSSRIKALLKSSPRLLLDSLRFLLPTAIFFIKFLEWWYSPGSPARSLSKSPLGPAIPPPRMLPPHPQGIPFDKTAYGICPLCRKAISNATALPSGYPVAMKFGKRIQAQQIPGWSAYYLDYKFLKKIISSLAANRPASEAAALALGVRPPYALTQSFPQPLSQTSNATPTSSPLTSPGQPPFFPASNYDVNRGPDFQAHKAAFFFKLERELEKINAFYLRKEAELKLRMETLLSKRRAAALRGMPNSESPQNRAEWSAVEEGFRLLERDLGKLQQFIEINAEGFRKILKKFDKRSTSTTKELYLTRQVDVQPVFNRQLISELANTVATCLLDITDLTSGLNFEGPNANDIFTQQLLNERPIIGPFGELESNFYKAIATGDLAAIKECVASTDVLRQQGAPNGNLTRMLWNVIIHAPSDLADLILASLLTPFDYHFVDDINGRTCLHEASIEGAQQLVDLCLRNGVLINKPDLYGRTALHYAAMKGHAEVCRQLLKAHIAPNSLDRDNYSPLVYATVKGNVNCVRVLLDEGRVSAQSPTASGDLSPLSLAAQAGHVDVADLLLTHRATPVPNTNGEYPMHLAAQRGHVDACKLLLPIEGWDKADKYHEWTPLFHAARHGHTECVRVLLDKGARASHRDEFGHLAAHYAAWYGHHPSLALLLLANKDEGPSRFTLLRSASISPYVDPSLDPEIDMIPSLSLPPPIMPHRVYGHNYLVNNHLVQISIGHRSSYSSQRPSVRLHHRLISPVFKDEYLLTTSPLKLVMTTSSNVNSAPYSMTLPPQHGEGYFAFQTPSLDDLSLEFSVYPNFGTKTIGRAVALPSMFAGVRNNESLCIPVLDHRLHTIGEASGHVDFQINIVHAFEGVTLEVGGGVETYWKSTEIASDSSFGYSGQMGHLSMATASSNTSPAFTRNRSEGLPLTHSSLYGSYLRVVVQVTRDLRPVVYSEWLLPGTVSELGVADVTLEQFEALARASGGQCDLTPGAMGGREYTQALSTCMVSLEYLLKSVPTSYNVVLELAYPATGTIEQLNLGRRLDLNAYVDSILRTIYGVSAGIGSPDARRKVAFSSSSPDVCAAFNWKQPNYPVFFASRCGGGPTTLDTTSKTALGSAGDDQRTCSIGAAVEFAKSNNLLGIFIDAELLIRVPSVVDGIRSAELIVGVLGSPAEFAQLTSAESDSHAVDAYFDKGTMSFIDRSARDM